MNDSNSKRANHSRQRQREGEPLAAAVSDGAREGRHSREQDRQQQRGEPLAVAGSKNDSKRGATRGSKNDSERASPHGSMIDSERGSHSRQK